MMTYFGGDPEFVYGYVDGDATKDSDGSAFIYFKNGLRGFADAGPKVAPTYFEVVGTEGVFRLNYDGVYTFSYLAPDKESGYIDRLVEQPFPGAPAEALARAPGLGQFVSPAAIDEVVRCLDENVESSSNGRQARRALEISVGVFESHRKGGALIQLPNVERTLSIPEGIPQGTLIARERF